MTFLDQTQDYNPFTGDVNLNPAAWGLSLKDINSAASVELKSSLYAGNINLTADQYREVQSLVADKYSAIDTTGIIAPGAITKNGELAGGIDMTDRDPGLYMSNDRLGFYDGAAWQVWIGNNGDFFFGGDVDNYIEWSGTTLTVKGDIEVADGSITAPKLAASLVYAGEIVVDTAGEIRSGQTAYNTGTGFWLGNDGGVPKFSIGNGTKGFTWDGTNATIRGNLYAESGTFTGSITSTATITGGILQSATSGKRIVIESNTFKSYDSSDVLRVQTADNGLRVTEATGSYYADISSGYFTIAGTPWPFLQISDISTPANTVGIRTKFLTAQDTSGLGIFLRGGTLSFKGIANTVGDGIELTSPDDATLVLSGDKIILGGKTLYSDGTDLYWNGVKIN